MENSGLFSIEMFTAMKAEVQMSSFFRSILKSFRNTAKQCNDIKGIRHKTSI